MRHYLGYLHRTSPDVWESELRPRLDVAAQQYPCWRLWLALLATTLQEAAEPVWPAATVRLQGDRLSAAPLLAGAQVTLDSHAVQHWVERFLDHLRQGVGSRYATRSDIRRPDALALFQAALCLDEPRLEGVAQRIGIEPLALGAVAHLVTLPLLHACGRSLGGQLPVAWPHGYCPVCGVWPAFAELRGLDRAYQLRCGRCGTDWATTWLRCLYCGESNHQQLGFLVPEGSGETRKVATCQSCKGYVKTLTTLQGSSSYAIPLDDLATMDLDIAAVERGYARPSQLSCRIDVCWSERQRRWRTLIGRHA